MGAACCRCWQLWFSGGGGVVILIGSSSSSCRGSRFRQWLGDGTCTPSSCVSCKGGCVAVCAGSCQIDVTRRGKPSWPCRCTCKHCVIVSTTIFKFENVIPIIRDGHDGPSLDPAHVVSPLPSSSLRYVVSRCRDGHRRRRVVPSLCRVVLS